MFCHVQEASIYVAKNDSQCQKESYSGNYNQGHCTIHDMYLKLLSFLIICGRKLAMEMNIHRHNSINNANQVTHIKHT